jgi:hypothetical protein
MRPICCRGFIEKKGRVHVLVTAYASRFLPPPAANNTQIAAFIDAPDGRQSAAVGQ